ncbi:MAG: aldose 1-epimerase [Gemmatimonadaceae bacterium]
MADANAKILTPESVMVLTRPAPPDTNVPTFLSAQIVPERGMMLLQIRAQLPGRGSVDLLASPPIDDALAILRADSGDFAGNKSFSIGGAFLLPFANRIRGTLSSDGKTITTNVLGKSVTLPANWGGQVAGAERYAMHGLALASAAGHLKRETTSDYDQISGSLDAGDFGGHWLSTTRVSYVNTLSADAFTVSITAENVGAEQLPMGIGWHPYFALPSRRREQARVHVPATERALVNNYDEVLPTGGVVPVAGTPYDFSAPNGVALGDLYLDDCFVGLLKNGDGSTVCEIIDPEASYGLRVIATSADVTAVQVYAPPDKTFVALEPQFNWADPFGPEWRAEVNTGMVVLQPGESVTYTVRLELFTP